MQNHFIRYAKMSAIPHFTVLLYRVLQETHDAAPFSFKETPDTRNFASYLNILFILLGFRLS